jgi:hypothetical protein
MLRGAKGRTVWIPIGVAMIAVAVLILISVRKPPVSPYKILQSKEYTKIALMRPGERMRLGQIELELISISVNDPSLPFDDTVKIALDIGNFGAELELNHSRNEAGKPVAWFYENIGLIFNGVERLSDGSLAAEVGLSTIPPPQPPTLPTSDKPLS